MHMHHCVCVDPISYNNMSYVPGGIVCAQYDTCDTGRRPEAEQLSSIHLIPRQLHVFCKKSNGRRATGIQASLASDRHGSSVDNKRLMYQIHSGGICHARKYCENIGSCLCYLLGHEGIGCCLRSPYDFLAVPGHQSPG